MRELKSIESGHTGIAEGIDNLVGLLLIIELPGLLEGAHRRGRSVRAVLLLTEIKAIKDEDTANPQVLEGLELLLDVVLQGEWEATESAQQSLAGGLVGQVLGNIVRRIDTDDRALQGGEGEGLATAIDPVVKRTD